MCRLSPSVHPLLTQPIINMLFAKNVYTRIDFVDANTKQLCIITGLTYKNISTIRRHIINKNAAATRKGTEYFHYLVRHSAILPTHIKSVDVMLGGGLATGNIYELCGLPASGKTQFCLTLAKNAVLELKQKVFYFDTKRDFSANRIKIMLEDSLNKVEIGKTLSNILVKRVNTIHELINSLYSIKDQLQHDLKVKFFILDSLPPLLYQSQDVTRKNGYLNHCVNIMRYICVEYHATFIITNIFTTWYEGNFSEESNLMEIPACGKYWSSIPNVKLKIARTGDGKDFVMSVVKGNGFEKLTDCVVNIGKCGMT